MRVETRLYERAAASTAGSLWHVGEGLAFFAGPLGHNALHSHSVPVLLAGLYGAFRLRIAGADWLSCRSAVVPAGVAYEFDLAGDPLGVLYLEPNIGGVDALTPLVRNASEINRAVVGSSDAIACLREAYEGEAGGLSPDEALRDLLTFSRARARSDIDPRIAKILEGLKMLFGNATPAAELSRSVGLSASRLQHLFAREVGVPLRRYRTWQRLRAAIQEVVGGSTYTHAAHAAGFYDQSHFSREFRRTFGAPASRGIGKRRDQSPTRRA
jgi:AraC-like DNA-binding protein